MRYRRLGEPGHEIPVAYTETGLFDLRPLTEDVDGSFLAGVSTALVRHELEQGRLPAIEKGEGCGWVRRSRGPGRWCASGSTTATTLARPVSRSPTSRWCS